MGDSEGSAGRYAAVDWGGRRVRAWVPAPLRDRDLILSSATARAAERAVAALRVADARLPSEWEPLARLLLRHEGVASSGIEGLREPPVASSHQWQTYAPLRPAGAGAGTQPRRCSTCGRAEVRLSCRRRTGAPPRPGLPS